MPFHYSVCPIASARSAVVHEPDPPKTYLLDTNVLIDLAAGIPLSVSDDEHILVSVLSLGELTAPGHMDLVTAESLIDDVTSGNVTPVTRDIARLAVELRTIQSLSAVDACIAATACICNATLVTNDGQMRRHPVLETSPYPFISTKEI